ncbi:hypothetical protein [Methanococcoides seepicolus]|uniref:Uncharacterized protein n=1 Tax=Methanococcoides seepicolus TaxID=2828780 RepID=A0A9E5DBN2_9EURY|nr:hypothetical protein [Methanococcoides seepicolus]MCM1986304.1 hypothetical protein [Methanococcoides seepicolus]
MELKQSADKKTEYLDRIKAAIENPKYSIFVILGLPFIFALIWVLFEIGLLSKTIGPLIYIFRPFLLFDIFIFPFIALACYGYYTGNKYSSAALGLLMYPLMIFYGPPIHTILTSQFEQFGRLIVWSTTFSNIIEFLPFSFAHVFMGYLVAFRKRKYLAIALLLFIIQAVAFFIKYTNLIWGI